jgi:hypothetical protein
MDCPYQAKTNKDTKLVTVDDGNIAVRDKTEITVHFERGRFGDVTIRLSGEEKFGLMLRDDYTAV